MTPEERLRMQKESDLQLALETTFGENVAGQIDNFHPTTKEEFGQLCEALNKKLSVYSKDPEFPTFAEDHIRNMCALCKFLKIIYNKKIIRDKLIFQ